MRLMAYCETAFDTDNSSTYAKENAASSVPKKVLIFSSFIYSKWNWIVRHMWKQIFVFREQKCKVTPVVLQLETASIAHQSELW